MMRGYGYGYGYGPGGMMSGYGGGLLGFFLMALFGLLIVAGVVLVIVWAMRTSGRAGGTQMQGPAGSGGAVAGRADDEACRIARERLAKGEITVEEYEKLKCALEE